MIKKKKDRLSFIVQINNFQLQYTVVRGTRKSAKVHSLLNVEIHEELQCGHWRDIRRFDGRFRYGEEN